MLRRRILAGAAALAVGALSLASCRSRTETKPTRQEAARKLRDLERRLAEKQATPPAAAPPAPAVSSMGRSGAGAAMEPEPAPSTEPPPASRDESPDAPFVADDPVELGPPGPATASARGIVMNTVEGKLMVATLGALARGPLSHPTPVHALPEPSGPFALVRGPSLSEEFAYWISHGSLVRRKLLPHGEPGPLEILARDALDGTRVGVPLSAPGQTLAKIPATVAYVVRPTQEGAPFLAKLWVEGAEPLLLTAEGNGAHSVSLVHTSYGVLALSVQARMAMTPVHARQIRFSAGHPELGEEVVTWVGGGIQPLTEMAVLPHGSEGLFGFIPHERSMKEFGIARLDIGMSPTMDTKATWMLYPNGIEPAPVAAGHVCGEPALLYAAPETAAPESKQELVLRVLGDGPSKSERLATARSFYFTSIAEVSGGALAAWVTDEGTWAGTVRCKTTPK